MDAIPTSVMTAVAMSTAAGKNPWLPFGLLFVLAAPAAVPELFIEPHLHAQLHALGPPVVLYTLGAVFLVLALADSLADKISLVEKWLVPVSTAWRPFAGVAVSAIVAYAAARTPAAQELGRELGALAGPAGPVPLVAAPGGPAALGPLPVATADLGASALVGGSVFALSVLLGSVYGVLSSIGKTGTRLLLSLVPLPALRLAHSFVDDLFALGVCVLGLAHAGDTLAVAAAILYLGVGLLVAPLFLRLARIHLKIGLALLRKGGRVAGAAEARTHHEPPAWVREALAARGVDPGAVTCLPAYAYRLPELGRVRDGWLVFGGGAVRFVARVWFRARVLDLHGDRLARVGLAQTATTRMVTLVERVPGAAGAPTLREALLYLYPATEDEIVPLVERAAGGTSLVRVRPDSGSARAALPGFVDAGRSVRFLPASEAGSLRAQALTTIVAAIAIGVLTGGVFVPIGAGYALSPFRRRFVGGLLLSVYLSLCVVGTWGLGWPAALVYATLLNAVALRDLARAALRARVDGFVDRRAFLPPVADRVWVPQTGLRSEADRWAAGDAMPVTDGGWRAVLRGLDRGVTALGAAGDAATREHRAPAAA
jgi:hypothetical protein